MQIWIIYHDISLAHSLKEQLRKWVKKVEILDGLPYFLEKLKKAKNSSLLPDGVLVDLTPDSDEFLRYHITLQEEQNPLTQKIVYASSLNYETFAAYFESRGVIPPPFIQKSQLLQKLETQVAEWKAQASPKNKESTNLPLPQQRSLKTASNLHEKISDLYYQNLFTKETMAIFRQHIEGLTKATSILEWPGIGGQAQRFLKIMEEGGGALRLKKELRELLLLTEKEIKKCGN